jgi:hypothetical protein
MVKEGRTLEPVRDGTCKCPRTPFLLGNGLTCGGGVLAVRGRFILLTIGDAEINPPGTWLRGELESPSLKGTGEEI